MGDVKLCFVRELLQQRNQGHDVFTLDELNELLVAFSNKRNRSKPHTVLQMTPFTAKHGYDISNPAAVQQWGQLSAKEQHAERRAVQLTVHQRLHNAAKAMQCTCVKKSPWPQLQLLTVVAILDEHKLYTKTGIIAVAYTTAEYDVFFLEKESVVQLLKAQCVKGADLKPSTFQLKFSHDDASPLYELSKRLYAKVQKRSVPNLLQ